MKRFQRMRMYLRSYHKTALAQFRVEDVHTGPRNLEHIFARNLFGSIGINDVDVIPVAATQPKHDALTTALPGIA
jgi:hypothetical protein